MPVSERRKTGFCNIIDVCNERHEYLVTELSEIKKAVEKLSGLLLGNGTIGALEKLRNLPCIAHANALNELRKDLKPLQQAYWKFLGGTTVGVAIVTIIINLIMK